MKKVTIVGAGFSGMSLAFHLVKQGFQVEIYEKNNRSGGMIQTHQLSSGLAESAANGFLNTHELENFLIDIKADYIGNSTVSKKRYIYRNKPQRWPLTFFETIQFIFKFLIFLTRSTQQKKAQPVESVSEWSNRNFGQAVTEFLIAPALQGIYAGNVAQLSASLIVNKLFGRNDQKKKSSSSLFSNRQGMGAIQLQLEKVLIEKGVQFYFEKQWSKDIQTDALVIASSAYDAALILSQIQSTEAQFNFEVLKKIEFLPLMTATCFFAKAPKKYLGFGILFPTNSTINALGVLMNNSIFERYQKPHSETWIMGGAFNPKIVDLNEAAIKNIILENRKKVFQSNEMIIEIKLTQWPQALPHYTIELEKKINMLKPMKNIFLHGNYLGNLGLSRILESSRLLAQTIKDQCI
jgi:oxygen-dependent protoporphyrinogen oxidase